MLVAGIGLWSSKFSSQGVSHFFVGGRKMNRVVVALSAVVSGRSSWLLLGLTGIAWTRGVSAIWAAVGYIAVEWYLFKYMAPRLREDSESLDAITVTDYFGEKFRDTGLLRIVLTAVIMVFMISYVSAQFVAGGKTFSSGLGLSTNGGMILTAGIVLLYTLVGGFLAVSITDVVQALLMLFALLVVPIMGIVNLGGMETFITSLSAISEGHFALFDIGAGTFLAFVGIGLGSPGNPHIIARYLSIDDARHFNFVARLGTFWNVVMALGAVLIGLVGRVYFPEEALLVASDPENVFPMLAQTQVSPLIFGVILAAIFAAIMSTADSQLLVAASGIVRDIYQRILQRDKSIDDSRTVLLSRVVILVLVLIALGLGWLADELVFWLVLFAWAGLGASLGPTLLLSVFWDKTTRLGVLAGIISGAVTVIIWYFTLKSVLYELIPAFLVSGLFTIVVSKWESKRKQV